MFLSIPLRKFKCKDNTEREQKLSTSILFNLKSWRIVRNCFTIRLKYTCRVRGGAGGGGGGGGCGAVRKKGLISLSAN